MWQPADATPVDLGGAIGAFACSRRPRSTRGPCGHRDRFGIWDKGTIVGTPLRKRVAIRQCVRPLLEPVLKQFVDRARHGVAENIRSSLLDVLTYLFGWSTHDKYTGPQGNCCAKCRIHPLARRDQALRKHKTARAGALARFDCESRRRVHVTPTLSLLTFASPSGAPTAAESPSTATLEPNLSPTAPSGLTSLVSSQSPCSDCSKIWTLPGRVAVDGDSAAVGAPAAEST